MGKLKKRFIQYQHICFFAVFFHFIALRWCIFSFSIISKWPDKGRSNHPYKNISKIPAILYSFMYFCFFICSKKNFTKDYSFFCVDLLSVFVHFSSSMLCTILTYKKWVFNLSKFRTKEFFLLSMQMLLLRRNS